MWILLFLLATPIYAIAQTTPPDLQGLPRSATTTTVLATDDQIDLLEDWLVAVGRHTGGAADESVSLVASWDIQKLQYLWLHAQNLARVMRDPNVSGFSVTGSDRIRKPVVYTAPQLRRLRVLACVADGHVGVRGATNGAGALKPDCPDVKMPELPIPLQESAERYASDARRNRDDNTVLRRAAILHSDIAMSNVRSFSLSERLPLDFGPRRIRLELADGRPSAITLAGVHWELAETLLRYSKPPSARMLAPEQDAWVRRWYIATLTWLHHSQQYDDDHLAEAQRLFGDDPEVLFLAGCQNEALASPEVQAGRHELARAKTLRTQTTYLRAARAAFERVVQLRPEHSAAALHLGHVLIALGDAKRAVAVFETLRGLENLDDRYYSALFLGSAYEHSGNFSGAEKEYLQAIHEVPGAQSAQLALSQLMLRLDDREAARSAINPILERPGTSYPEDPWWSYYQSHSRNARVLISNAWIIGGGP